MATNVKKNTAKLMVKKLQARLDALYNEQEAMKPQPSPNQAMQTMRGGGMIRGLKKYYDGGYKNIFSNEPSSIFDPSLTSDFNKQSFMNLDKSNVGPVYRNQMLTNPVATTTTPPTGNAESGGGFNWNTVLTGLGTAPLAYNLIAGLQKPEELNARDYANPEYNNAIGLMSNRRFDVNPLLEANMSAERVAGRDLAQASGSGGRYLAGRGSLAASRMRADAQAYSTKQNADNQYRAEEAQLRGSLGSESAQNRWRVGEANSMNRAARRQHLGAAATGVSNWAQTQQLMRNKKNVDMMGLETMVGTDYFADRYKGFNDYYTKNIKTKK